MSKQDRFSRRQALAALMALPVASTGIVDADDAQPWPDWAESWDEAALTMANMEANANRQQFPTIEPRLCYVSAMQFSAETFLIYGVRGFDEFRRHVASPNLDVLGAALSRDGTTWAVVVVGVLSDGLRAEFRSGDEGRERRQRSAEQYARWKEGQSRR